MEHYKGKWMGKGGGVEDQVEYRQGGSGSGGVGSRRCVLHLGKGRVDGGRMDGTGIGNNLNGTEKREGVDGAGDQWVEEQMDRQQEERVGNNEVGDSRNMGQEGLVC